MPTIPNTDIAKIMTPSTIGNTMSDILPWVVSIVVNICSHKTKPRQEFLI